MKKNVFVPFYLNEVFCTFWAPGICLYTSFSWMEENTVLSDTVIIHALSDNKQKHTHVIGHFLAELFGFFGVGARQGLREQLV